MKKYILYILIAVGVVAAAAIYLDIRKPVLQMPTDSADLPMPTDSSGKIPLQNYGAAPDFAKIAHWLNSDPLTIASLKGKVVLVDFWTYSCINCIRALPYVTKWYDTYKDKGFVVVGVHTPEFGFEKDTANVQAAVARLGIHYPVAQDNSYGTWQNYNNQYWPAEYLIDQNGNIVYTHFGEGNYDHTENAIRELLGMNTAQMPSGNITADIGSPEMYFGTARLANLSPAQQPSKIPASYNLPQQIDLNTFALEGSWQFSDDNAALVSGPGKIRLKFHSGKAYIVAQSAQPVTLTITVDGKEEAPVVIQASSLYTLFDSNDYSDHILEITIPQGGFEAFTFTFG